MTNLDPKSHSKSKKETSQSHLKQKQKELISLFGKIDYDPKDPEYNYKMGLARRSTCQY